MTAEHQSVQRQATPTTPAPVSSEQTSTEPSQTPAFRRLPIRRLQALAGNHSVAQLLTVQRRVPSLAELDALAANPDTLKKLKKALIRTVNVQDTSNRNMIIRAIGGDLNDYVAKAGKDEIRNLVSIVEKLVSSMHELDELLKQIDEGATYKATPGPIAVAQYPGAKQTFVAWDTLLTTAPEQTAMRDVVNAVAQEIEDAGKDTAAIKRVFGDASAKTAGDNFTKAAAGIRKLLASNKIGADLSGESREMSFGGLTSPQSMLLAKGFFDGLVAKPDDAKHTLCHETFHTADSTIRDEGGYRHEAQFLKRSEPDKLRNAEHYVEVVAQVKWGATVRTLTPAPAKSKTTTAATGGPDDVGKAHSLVTDQLRTSWVMALNMHGHLKDFQEKQRVAENDWGTWDTERQEIDKKSGWYAAQKLWHRTQEQGKDLNTPEQRNKYLYYSRLLGLTLHDRVVADQRFPVISDLDLTLSEGVTRALATAYGQKMSGLPSTNADWTTSGRVMPIGADDVVQTALTSALLDAALQAVGPIRKSLARDKAMVADLYKLYGGSKIPTAAALPK